MQCTILCWFVLLGLLTFQFRRAINRYFEHLFRASRWQSSPDFAVPCHPSACLEVLPVGGVPDFSQWIAAILSQISPVGAIFSQTFLLFAIIHTFRCHPLSDISISTQISAQILFDGAIFSQIFSLCCHHVFRKTDRFVFISLFLIFQWPRVARILSQILSVGCVFSHICRCWPSFGFFVPFPSSPDAVRRWHLLPGDGLCQRIRSLVARIELSV